MVWFRVDDNFADHPKVRRIPRSQRAAAVGLWTLAGTWASRHLRDGRIPAYMVEELCGKPASAAALVRCGLWHEHGHDCPECPSVAPESFVFHQWASLQFTREEVMKKREADAERQRLARERKRAEQESRERHSVTDADEDRSHASVQDSRPVPSRPVPEKLDSSVGGARQETLRAVPDVPPQGIDDPEPAPFCPDHMPDGADVNCGRCAGARKRHDRWAQRDDKRAKDFAAAVRKAIDDCDVCDEHGRQLDPDTHAIVGVCGHNHRRSA